MILNRIISLLNMKPL